MMTDLPGSIKIRRSGDGVGDIVKIGAEVGTAAGAQV